MLEKIRKTATFLIGGFFLGVFLQSLIDFGWSFFYLAILLALAFLFLFLIFKKSGYLILAIIFCGLALGGGRLEMTNPQIEKIPVGQTFILKAKIIEEPDEREAKTRLIVSENKTGTKILISTERFPKYNLGDEIKVTGKLAKPANFLTTIGKEFDYQNYLATSEIYYQMFSPQIELLKTGGVSLTGLLIGIKNNFLTALAKVLPEPQNSLMGGLVLGLKSGLGTEIENNFRRTGLSHMIVLSGYNITIISAGIMSALFFLPRIISFGGGIIGIILFILMVGSGASAVRAATMAILALLARGYGRLYDAGLALIIAGFFMVVWNPRLLVFDFGFQLSFLATLGIIFLAPVIEDFLCFLPQVWTRLGSPNINIVNLKPKNKMEKGFRELVATTLGAQIMVFPWILYKMGNLSIVGLLANIIVLPIVPIAMFFGFITGALGIISTTVSMPFAYISHFLLSYILFAAEKFAQIPFASLELKNFPLVLVLLVYILILVFLLKYQANVAKNQMDNN